MTPVLLAVAVAAGLGRQDAPPPEFVERKSPAPDEILRKKSEGWYLTGIPLIGVDPELGPVIGAQAQVFDNMYDGVVLTDAENRIIGWNRGAERIFGYSEAEVLGKCPEMLNPPELGPELTRAFRRQLALDGRWSGLVPFIRKGGAAGTCEVVCVPMTDESGRTIGAGCSR